MNKLQIIAVAPNMIDFIWEEVTPIIERVIKKAPTTLSLKSEYNKILAGNTILVIIHEDTKIIAVNTLEIIQYGTGKRSLAIPITGGDRLLEWMDDFVVIAEAIAKDLNCTSLVGYSCRDSNGKDAWLRALNKNKTTNKWVQIHTQIEKEIL